jgi:serine/threonine protein kinase
MLSGTMGGMILGTAAYMSPEQAKGRSVDRRTDIFAFGCVLFEMLTGKPPFDGDDVTEILGRVVTAEPDWKKLPADAPLTIQRLVRRALKKDVRQRLGDIHDAKLEIEEAIDAPPHPAEAKDSTIGKKRGGWAWVNAAIVFVAVSIPAIRHLLENPPDELRVEIDTLSTSAPLEFALSPNGRYLVYVDIRQWTATALVAGIGQNGRDAAARK